MGHPVHKTIELLKSTASAGRIDLGVERDTFPRFSLQVMECSLGPDRRMQEKTLRQSTCFHKFYVFLIFDKFHQSLEKNFSAFCFILEANTTHQSPTKIFKKIPYNANFTGDTV